MQLKGYLKEFSPFPVLSLEELNKVQGFFFTTFKELISYPIAEGNNQMISFLPMPHVTIVTKVLLLLSLVALF